MSENLRGTRRAQVAGLCVSMMLLGCGDDDGNDPADSGMAMMMDGATVRDSGRVDAGEDNDSGSNPDDASPPDSGPDLCESVTCINGTCNPTNGGCNCDEGFEGDECETAVLTVTDDLALWLDGADTDTMTFSGNDLTSWQDKGPNTLMFAPSNDNGPSLGGIGSTPALNFDGSEDLTGPGIAPLVNAAQYTMFVVVSASDDDNIITAYGGDNERMRLRDTEILGVTYSHSINSGVGGISFNSNPYARNEPHIITVQWTAGDTSVWVDGIHRQMEANTSPERLPGMDSFTLGADLQSGEGQNLRGSLGEVLVYSTRLSFADREAIEVYLSAKWDGSVTH